MTASIAVKPAVDRLRRSADLSFENAPELELIYDVAPVGLAFITPDCRYVQVNQRLTEIFEAFFTIKSRGMGMGLSICKTIVEAHGGRLWAEPATPRGTSFHAQLPAGGVVQ